MFRIKIELDESNQMNKNLQLKLKESQEFVLSSSKENQELNSRRATKIEAETGKIDLNSNKTSKFSSKDNQEKVSTISTAKDKVIINTVIENEPLKRVTRSTAKKIKLESLNQPKNLQNINEFEEQNEL